MNFLDFQTLATNDIPGWARPGQHAFNFLVEHRPDLSEQIRGDHAVLDPFYRQENLPAFWAWVEAHWDQP